MIVSIVTFFIFFHDNEAYKNMLKNRNGKEMSKMQKLYLAVREQFKDISALNSAASTGGLLGCQEQSNDFSPLSQSILLTYFPLLTSSLISSIKGYVREQSFRTTSMRCLYFHF